MEASVNLSIDEKRRMSTVVTLIEPEDRARVRYRAAVSAGEAPELPGWKDALAITGNAVDFQGVLLTYPLILKGKVDEAKRQLPQFGAKVAKVQPGWDFLKAHATPKDHELALWVLSQHGDRRYRTLALAVLLNFPDSDATWWHVADAVRDPDEMVNGFASTVLSILSRDHARAVNWQPAVVSLRHLLGGTNVSAYQTVLRTLIATHISPELCKDLLPDAGDLLVAYLKATHEPTRKLAADFLKHLSGGADRTPAEWQRWLEQFKAKT